MLAEGVVFQPPRDDLSDYLHDRTDEPVVPPGETATFTVAATSSQPITYYQWSENGVDIPGATGPSYTTPPVTLGANGSTLVGTFTVMVMNASDAVAASPQRWR